MDTIVKKEIGPRKVFTENAPFKNSGATTATHVPRYKFKFGTKFPFEFLSRDIGWCELFIF